VSQKDALLAQYNEDRFGQPRFRSEMAVEKDVNLHFAHLTRELQLDAGSQF